MDSLESKLMGLSTGAPEWKPGRTATAASVTTTATGALTTTTTTTTITIEVGSSDLNPTKVKEFVPGRGWSALSNNNNNSNNGHNGA
jgi:hypothetical protein